MHDLLVAEGAILHADQALCRRGVFPKVGRQFTNYGACPMLEVVLHHSVEAIPLGSGRLAVPISEHLIEDSVVLLLNGSSLLLEVLVVEEVLLL